MVDEIARRNEQTAKVNLRVGFIQLWEFRLSAIESKVEDDSLAALSSMEKLSGELIKCMEEIKNSKNSMHSAAAAVATRISTWPRADVHILSLDETIPTAGPSKKLTG